MAWHHEARAAVRAFLRRGREEAEMDEEMRFHLEMEARRLQAQGLSPDAARLAARRAFGGVDRYKEEVRDERGTRPVEDLLQDVKFAWRALVRRPLFTAVAALTLALGVGATTTLYGVVKAVLLAPLPWGHPERVAQVWSAWKGFDQTWISYDEWEGFRAGVRAFRDVAVMSDGQRTIGDGAGDPEMVRVAQVSHNVFDVLEVPPMLGRAFTEQEEKPNGPPAVILSHEVWMRRFGADSGIVGRSVRIGGDAVPVVGVMPPGFRLPVDYGESSPTRLYLPLGDDAESQGAVPGPEFNKDGGSHGYYAVARLAPGATVEQANGQLDALVGRLRAEGVYPPGMQFHAFAVDAMRQVTGRLRPVLLVVFAAVGLVLLIACANVAGLLLVRGEARRREMAVRLALGVRRGRLVRLLVTESLLLALIGGVAGVALAFAGTAAVRRAAPSALARVADTHVDGGVLLFAVVASALAALLSGLMPAMQSTRVAPSAELRDGGRGATAGGARLRWRQALVTLEVALAVLLVAGAGLMIRSVSNLFAIDPGFRAAQVLTLRVNTPATYYDSAYKVAAFWDELQHRVASIPGVDRVGAARQLPLAGQMGDWGIAVEGYTPPQGQGTPADWQVVTPGYMEAIGLRLRAGRFIGPQDDARGALSLVVNRRFVQLYVPGRDPIGTRVRVNGSDSTRWYSIVGVVDDVHHNGLTTDVKAQFYAPLAQYALAPRYVARSMSLAVHTAGDPRSITRQVRAAVRDLDPRLAVSEVRTMDEIVAASIAEPRFAMSFLAIFGVVALAMAAIGVFGIVSQVVALRAQEFGIRAALGASPGRLTMLGLRTGAVQAGTGLAIGVALALVLTRTMRAFLHGVAPTDPATLGGVLLVTGVVALTSSMWPALRASRVDPAAVLHDG